MKTQTQTRNDVVKNSLVCGVATVPFAAGVMTAAVSTIAGSVAVGLAVGVAFGLGCGYLMAWGVWNLSQL